MSTVTNQNSEAASQPSQPTSGVNALFQMEGVIAEVLGEAINAQGIQANSEQENGVILLQNDMNSTKNLDHQLDNQKSHHFWHKFLNIGVDIAMGAAIIGSLATGDVAGAVLMGGLMAAQLTGGQQAIAGGISKSLVAAGVSPDVANIVACAVVVVGFAVAGAGLGSIDSIGEAAEGIEGGVGAMEEGIDAAAEEGTSAASSEEVGLLDVGGSNIFEEEAEKAPEKGTSKAKKMLGSAILAASSSLGGVSLEMTQSIVDLSDKSGKDQKLITMLVELVFMVAAIAGSAGGAGLAFSGSEGGATAKSMQAGLKGVQGAFMAGEGVVNIQNGVTVNNIAKTNSELTMIHALTNRNSERLKDTTQRMNEIIQTLAPLLSETNFFSGMAAAAQEETQ